MTFLQLQILYILIFLVVKLAVFFGLVKLFNKKVKLLTAIEAFFAYEFVFFIATLIFYNGILLLHLMSYIALIVISCLTLLVITKKLNLLNWKKGLVFFLLMIMIITPILTFATNKFIMRSLPKNIDFERENPLILFPTTVKKLTFSISGSGIPVDLFFKLMGYSI